MINYCVIGGRRTEFYIRIAKLVSKTFSLKGVYVRNPDTAKKLKKIRN